MRTVLAAGAALGAALAFVLIIAAAAWVAAFGPPWQAAPAVAPSCYTRTAPCVTAPPAIQQPAQAP